MPNLNFSLSRKNGKERVALISLITMGFSLVSKAGIASVVTGNSIVWFGAHWGVLSRHCDSTLSATASRGSARGSRLTDFP